MTDPVYTAPRRRRQKNTVTIQDVATRAGVSIGTVSRVLNDRNWVKPETRARVMDAVASTGFVPNARARSLVTQRAQSVALVLGVEPTKLFEDPNYALILEEATDALADADYSLVLLTAATGPARERVSRYLRAGHVDGVLFISPAEPTIDPLVAFFQEGHLPVVVCGNPFSESVGLPMVYADDETGSRALGEHFRASGLRHPAVVAAYPHTSGPAERIGGFAAGYGDGPIHVQSAMEYSRAAGRAAAVELLQSGRTLDSIFATSDLLALGVIDALHAAGLAVPGDVAVAGFDDSSAATQAEPALTTVHQPVSSVARVMVEEILGAIEGDTARTRVLATDVVLRDSTRR
ncbi:LacI family DNA-binding transcriptional regulator [Microbacterium sp. KSW4-11]|uniref:LacI family DNA-binding transcriptional regulator n=1 Tax=Microbacterium gawkjiense TaxID=3067309 RepID=A0ABU3G9X8_9MICO|nr:LacI family DNA-binding transcriptional regulator [Microbacterium sp. KSW4-11]MDT3315842.1 LacI family DNA-binding transcriptional regulator [Microbacterium sp. KSW4-11]